MPTDDVLTGGIQELPGAFRDGVTSELAIRTTGLLVMYLPLHPVVAWELLDSSGFGGSNEHYAVVGSVMYEHLSTLWDYLALGTGPEPGGRDFHPDRPAKVAAHVVGADGNGINRLRER